MLMEHGVLGDRIRQAMLLCPGEPGLLSTGPAPITQAYDTRGQITR
jgi:hypothetical protein